MKPIDLSLYKDDPRLTREGPPTNAGEYERSAQERNR